MGLLTPTVRDSDRPPALQPTARPGVEREPAGPAAEVELPKGYELDSWLDVEGAGEIDRVALVKHGRFPAKTKIVKLYRPGIAPDAGVHEAWRRLGHKTPHIVQLHESGEIGGRTYEVMDDAGDRLGGAEAPASARRTTLRDVLADHPGGLAEAAVVDVVRQLGLALAALNRAGVAHLDLRPDNVLVHRRETGGGWDVTVVDFGLACPVDKSGKWDVSRAFSPYSAPELLLANRIFLATDWWSLGVIAAELATGRHPLDGLGEANIRFQLTDKNIPEPNGLPERVRPLLHGLTTTPSDRWGAAEVADWVNGAPPPPPPSPRPSPVRPFAFDGEEFRHIPPLTYALQGKWDEAVAVLFGPEADRWPELATWLRQFPDRPGFSAARVIEHVERLGTGPDPWPANARLLMLLRLADPSLVPLYGRLPVDPGGMSRAPVWGEPDFPEMAADFWQRRLFTELDGAKGTRGLADLDVLWRRLDTRCRAVTTVLANGSNPYQSKLASRPEDEWRRLLLRVAADTDFQLQLREDLTRLRAHISAELGEPLPRFEELAATVLPPPRRGRRSPGSPVDPDELVGLLMLHLAATGVRREVADIRERRQRLAADEAVRTVSWRRRERWREIERPVAMGWAAAAMGIVFVFAATLLVVADDALPASFTLASDSAVGVAWAFVVVGLAAQTACEVWLAATIGAPYHDEYSLATIFIRTAARVGRRWGNSYLRSAVVLAAVTAASAVAIVILLTAPYVLTAPLLALHIRSARRRYRQWQEAHADEEERSRGTASQASPERQPS